jgi:hypothetical protein
LRLEVAVKVLRRHAPPCPAPDVSSSSCKSRAIPRDRVGQWETRRLTNGKGVTVNAAAIVLRAIHILCGV